MNLIFQLLLSKPSVARPFLDWYNMRYPNTLSIFQYLPFPHQLGVFIEYYENLYKLAIVASVRGVVIHWTDMKNVELDPVHSKRFYHHRFQHDEPKTIMFGYMLAIRWLFDNIDLPF